MKSISDSDLNNVNGAFKKDFICSGIGFINMMTKRMGMGGRAPQG